MPTAGDPYRELGYVGPDARLVCSQCVDDPSLAKGFASDQSGAECAFCGVCNRPVGRFSDVLERIRDEILYEWSETSEKFEAHLLGTTPEDEDDIDGDPGTSLSDFFDYIDYRPRCRAYRDAVLLAFNTYNGPGQDVELYWRGPEDVAERDRHRNSWERFKRIVKHKRRYTFWADDGPRHDPYELFETSASGVLTAISNLINGQGLLRKVEVGAEFWRARSHPAGLRLEKPTGLFPPPRSKAVIANRMSPPGIVMFYGADRPWTTAFEVFDRGGGPHCITLGRFKTLRALCLLDLTDTSALPSYFDHKRRKEWEDTSFLRTFAAEISAPIDKGLTNHIEYTPTQAFTEYLRYQIKSASGDRIHGIKYRSSVDGEPCVAFFCDSRSCTLPSAFRGLNDRRLWLELQPKSLRTVRSEKIARRLAKLR